MPIKCLDFTRVGGLFAIVQMQSDAVVPEWAMNSVFCTVVRTPEELSFVCLEDSIPADAAVLHIERRWACLKLEGPFPFALTGILLSVLEPLARVHVSIFAVSTFNTDYILLKAESMAPAIAALEAAGHRFSP
jgi:uncharacterized protein